MFAIKSAKVVNLVGVLETVLISCIQGTGALAVATKLPELRPPTCHHGEACIPATAFQMTILYVSLYLIALGTGGLKSSISGFGSDQFDDKDPKEKAHMAFFFNRLGLEFIFMHGIITLL